MGSGGGKDKKVLFINQISYINALVLLLDICLYRVQSYIETNKKLDSNLRKKREPRVVEKRAPKKVAKVAREKERNKKP